MINLGSKHFKRVHNLKHATQIEEVNIFIMNLTLAYFERTENKTKQSLDLYKPRRKASSWVM